LVMRGQRLAPASRWAHAARGAPGDAKRRLGEPVGTNPVPGASGASRASDSSFPRQCLRCRVAAVKGRPLRGWPSVSAGFDHPSETVGECAPRLDPWVVSGGQRSGF